MKQNWIYKPWTDIIFILSPPFIILLIIAIGQPYIHKIETQYSFWTWILLIVLIDVAHVYASLFKTYLDKEEYNKHRQRYILVPIICLVVSIILCAFGIKLFWSILAYVAVFHFIRQQYGFMRLYSRKDTSSTKSKQFDNIVIYNATLFPMLYWFLHGDRNFNWFIPEEFFITRQPQVLQILRVVYYSIILLYLINTIYQYAKTKYFNIPKNILIVGTYLSWYFGIIYFNDDLVFTALNVVSHGVPYIALVYFKEVKNSPQKHYKLIGQLISIKGLILYIFILAILAFIEESMWDITVWNEHFKIGGSISNPIILMLLTATLSVPQFTHYILDAYIWKSPTRKQ